jgi:hypothetical protein
MQSPDEKLAILPGFQIPQNATCALPYTNNGASILQYLGCVQQDGRRGCDVM